MLPFLYRALLVIKNMIRQQWDGDGEADPGQPCTAVGTKSQTPCRLKRLEVFIRLKEGSNPPCINQANNDYIAKEVGTVALIAANMSGRYGHGWLVEACTRANSLKMCPGPRQGREPLIGRTRSSGTRDPGTERRSWTRDCRARLMPSSSGFPRLLFDIDAKADLGGTRCVWLGRHCKSGGGQSSSACTTPAGSGWLTD